MLSEVFYSQFQPQTMRIARELLLFLITQANVGRRVAYGAAAKGNTLLNLPGCARTCCLMRWTKTPAKQDKFLPGSRIPVVDEAHLRADQPDFVLILPWNLKAEVMDQLAYVRAWGGKFVTAVPQLEVL